MSDLQAPETPRNDRATLGQSARATVETAGQFGAMMLPFADRTAGAARINASLRTFAKPGTWFAPMWALLVGAVASGGSHWDWPSISKILLGMLLAGPLLCGFSQVLNDWFDREVDRINEPDRPTAAGAMSPFLVFWIAIGLFFAALAVGSVLGAKVLSLTFGGLALAYVYSVPPFRLKARNGWLANTACAFAYEGFAWIAGAAIFHHVTTGTIVLATLYSLGSHGLMTLNDFKSYEGDKRLGLQSIPVMAGRGLALGGAVIFIDLFQALAICYVLANRMFLAAGIMTLLFVIQLPMQRKLAADPAKLAPWYCASAIPPFVWGMLVAALAVRSGGF